MADAPLSIRGEHLKRSFARALDQGGLTRTTLKGTQNLTKRQIAAALTYDLSLLMRTPYGYGTPKQWLASRLFDLWRLLRKLIEVVCQCSIFLKSILGTSEQQLLLAVAFRRL